MRLAQIVRINLAKAFPSRVEAKGGAPMAGTELDVRQLRKPNRPSRTAKSLGRPARYPFW